MSLLMVGCVTIPSTPKIEDKLEVQDVTVDLSQKIPTSADTKLWWLVIFHDNDRNPLLYWVIKDDSLTFLQGGTSVVFKDPNSAENIILRNNYSFTIIRMNDWYHPDFNKDETEEEPPKKKEKPKVSC